MEKGRVARRREEPGREAQPRRLTGLKWEGTHLSRKKRKSGSATLGQAYQGGLARGCKAGVGRTIGLGRGLASRTARKSVLNCAGKGAGKCKNRGRRRKKGSRGEGCLKTGIVLRALGLMGRIWQKIRVHKIALLQRLKDRGRERGTQEARYTQTEEEYKRNREKDRVTR